MIQAILLVHFFRGGKFIGQKLQWVEFETSSELGTLIALLGRGCTPDEFRGNLDFPSEGKRYQRIRDALEDTYSNPYCEAAPEKNEGILRWNWQDADSVQVIQVIQNRSWKKPAFSPV
jgi:hypothetical protein